MSKLDAPKEYEFLDVHQHYMRPLSGKSMVGSAGFRIDSGSRTDQPSGALVRGKNHGVNQSMAVSIRRVSTDQEYHRVNVASMRLEHLSK